MNSDELWSLSCRHVRNITPKDLLPVVCVSQEIVQCLDVPTDLAFVLKSIGQPISTDTREHELIVWIEALLRNPLGIADLAAAESKAEAILTWTLQAISLPSYFNARSPLDPELPPEPSNLQICRFRIRALAGIRLLSQLWRLFPLCVNQDLTSFAWHLAVFTDEDDPWTHPESALLSVQLLKQLLDSQSTRSLGQADDLVSRVLKDIVRPPFSKVKSNKITQLGRKAISESPVRQYYSPPDYEEKPWKFRVVRVTSVFRWCLEVLEANSIQENWPLLIPPLLAQIDDEETVFKVKGCKALVQLLRKVDAGMLQRTGLGEIFEQALLPLLNYLPTFTPEDESLHLLEHTFTTLVALSRTRFPAASNLDQTHKSLDKVLRDGVVHGSAIANEYPKIMEKLMQQLTKLVDEMGIRGIKHLKVIIPLLADILCNPFITAHIPLLIATSEALQTVIVNWWPRTSAYNGEIMKSISVCWVRIVEEEKEQKYAEAQSCLRKCLDLLKATVAQDKESLQDMEHVLNSDPRLAGLVQ